MAPRTRIVVAVAVVGIGLLAAAVWYFLIRDDAPPPLTLEAAITTTTLAATPGTEAPVPTGPEPTQPPAATAAPTSTEVPATDPPAAADPSGDWVIDPTNTIVGYRIEEELAGIGGNTAVGRTSEVTGSLTLDGAAITAVSVTVDMTTLQSGDNRRDRQMRTRGFQSSQFPEATFVLDEPIMLDEVPQVGETITATALGTLTLHGVSRSVEVSLEAQLIDASTIVVVGSTEVALADYDINPPTGFSVLSVADVGLFEFQLTFKAGT